MALLSGAGCIAVLLALVAGGWVSLPLPFGPATAPTDHHEPSPTPVPNTPPRLVFALNVTTTPTLVPVELNASLSRDAEGPIESYLWTIHKGATDGPVVATYQSRVATHPFAKAGTYFVHLQVTDDGGTTVRSGPFEAKVLEVTDRLPMGEPTWAPSAPTVGQRVDFSVHPTDVDGEVEQVRWDLWEADVPASAPPLASGRGTAWSFTFSDSGAYRLVLSLTDDDGQNAATTRTVLVG